MPISQSCSQHPTSDFFFFGGGRNFKNHKEQHKYFFRLLLKYMPALEALSLPRSSSPPGAGTQGNSSCCKKPGGKRKAGNMASPLTPWLGSQPREMRGGPAHPDGRKSVLLLPYTY